jgi:hypothetical protein
MYFERISHMTDSETFEQVGRKRAEYRDRKKELAQLRSRAGDLSKLAATISAGLEHPELIRWWEGTPMVGKTQQHVVLSSQMFTELTEPKIKELCNDIKAVETRVNSLRTELTRLDEDPER